MRNELIAAVAFLALGCTGASAGPVANPAPEYKDAKLHAACQDEGTLSSMKVAKPLICVDHKWQQVVFKTNPDGSAQPLVYNGKCSYRFVEGQEQIGTITLKAGQLADVCIPAGWKFQMAASSDSLNWFFNHSESIENVMLVKAMTPGVNSTTWVYASSPNSKEVQKIVVNLRSAK
ncbi:hypothetical protein HA052_19720 [Chromobacterium haemolyticum]|uniref:Lipoprotein n=1 Tax=Chromobacterium fluminis TaxID=3044269 RepID=A0ABX0LDV0_9NEIS|nr:hypothetical protein [Chromobacterium haemolyticum]NHR07423.1 hypothetical protein [Chromobacterium haemolyticum]